MNVRCFLLIAMTVFFAALWSSDQRYQEAQALLALQSRARVEAERANAVAELRSRLQGIPVIDAAAVLLDGQPITQSLRNIMDRAWLNDGLNWGSQFWSQIEEDQCWLRWRVRQSVFFARRRMSSYLGPAANWRDLADRLTREALRPIESAAARGTMAPATEER